MDEHFNTLDHQDWKTIIVKKPKQNVKNAKKKVNNNSEKIITNKENETTKVSKDQIKNIKQTKPVLSFSNQKSLKKEIEIEKEKISSLEELINVSSNTRNSQPYSRRNFSSPIRPISLRFHSSSLSGCSSQLQVNP